ncbi:MAG: sialate O-acetylesterase [Phycisphaerae bacterium]|jgi:sialate O-acetylesterase
MRKISISGSCFFIITILISSAYSNIEPAAIFCDHMVLQQKADVPIWGWAQPDEKITVQPGWLQESVSVTADKQGNWKTQIKTPEAGGPYTIKISGQNEIILSDVLIGEVWVCSGQSNMEVCLEWLGTERSKKDIKEANNQQIRIFDIKDRFSFYEEKDCTGSWNTWLPATSDHIRWFSAVGYYFGKTLQEKLNVPIGLISSHWGGTAAESWMDLDTIKKFQRLETPAEIISGVRDNNKNPDDAFRQLLDEWLKKVADEDDGIKNKWFEKDMNDTDWQQMSQPVWWSGSSLKGVHGIVWFRKEFILPTDNEPQDMELNLGTIDDIDSVWINNNYIGTIIGWDIKRIYKIPAAFLHKGPNLIAVRVIDTGGDGGFGGKKEDLKISSAGKDPQSLAGQWRYKTGNPKTDWQVPQFTAINQYSPTALFNAMIAPLMPYRIAGAIWYQGEGNVGFPIEYRKLFPAMIENWRSRWGQGNFPFYYVQIAPWDYGDASCSQALREAQMMTLSEPNTGMAVVMDIGEEKDIHPKNKHDVGDRLARWALNKIYGKSDVVFSGPLYKEMKIDGNSIRLFFDYAQGGLVAKGGELTYFTIAGEDRKFVSAKAVIDGETIVVSNPQIEKPVAVRFAWSNWVQPNLFNTAILPASSFRTDYWPLQ